MSSGLTIKLLFKKFPSLDYVDNAGIIIKYVCFLIPKGTKKCGPVRFFLGIMLSDIPYKLNFH